MAVECMSSDINGLFTTSVPVEFVERSLAITRIHLEFKNPGFRNTWLDTCSRTGRFDSVEVVCGYPIAWNKGGSLAAAFCPPKSVFKAVQLPPTFKSYHTLSRLLNANPPRWVLPHPAKLKAVIVIPPLSAKDRYTGNL